MIQFDLKSFISKNVTEREQSLFQADIDQFHSELSKEINHQSVLVIGGAGTIGSSFIRALLKYRPAKLVVVDTNENGLTELTRDLRSASHQYVPNDFITYPMNFGDRVFEKMFVSHGPFDIVANFAAHKHVRSEKDIFSIEAMVENNVLKAKKFLDFLEKHPPKHFFCVSTDKAAHPVNVMGASKKVMEDVIMTYRDSFKVTTARFANVAFSNGSLLAGYLDRFAKNQPLSCPSDVKRFFVSPDESGQICLIACILGKSGEIYFPKLEEKDLMSFKVITERLFRELNLPFKTCETEEEARMHATQITSEGPYPVCFFESDTSGEKMYEEFYTESDQLDLKYYRGIGIIQNVPFKKKEDVFTFLNQVENLLDSGDNTKGNLVQLFQNYLKDFKHIETGKSLDHKM